MSRVLLLVDGHALACRFAKIRLYYGRKSTRVLSGFLHALRKASRMVRPDATMVCWDEGECRWRKGIDPEYKSGRPVLPVARTDDIRRLQDVLVALGIWQFSQRGVEADDWIAYMARMAIRRGGYGDVVIFSTDKDLCQCVTPRTRMLDPGRGYRVWGYETVCAEFGVPPAGIPQVLALAGDRADGIVGLRGVGRRRAAKMFWCDGPEHRDPQVVRNLRLTRLDAEGEHLSSRSRGRVDRALRDGNGPFCWDGAAALLRRAGLGSIGEALDAWKRDLCLDREPSV